MFQHNKNWHWFTVSQADMGHSLMKPFHSHSMGLMDDILNRVLYCYVKIDLHVMMYNQFFKILLSENMSIKAKCYPKLDISSWFFLELTHFCSNGYPNLQSCGQGESLWTDNGLLLHLTSKLCFQFLNWNIQLLLLVKSAHWDSCFWVSGTTHVCILFYVKCISKHAKKSQFKTRV